MHRMQAHKLQSTGNYKRGGGVGAVSSVRQILFFVCFGEADEFNIKASLSEQVCVLEYRIRLRKNFAICDSAVSRPHPNVRSRRNFTFASADQLAKYRISSIRRRGYYFFAVRFSAATNRGRLLFEGGVYFFGKPADSNDG